MSATEALRAALEKLKPHAAYGRAGTRDVDQAALQAAIAEVEAAALAAPIAPDRAAMAAAPAPAAQPVQALAGASPAPAPSASVDFLGAGDLADLRRLDECFSDGEGYNLPKARMQRLAELGVVRRTGRYCSITAFGQHCLDPEWGLPLRTAQQINADQAKAAQQEQSNG